MLAGDGVKSELSGNGVGFLFLWAIAALAIYLAMSAGWAMGRAPVPSRVIVHTKYLDGGPRSGTLYLDCRMLVNDEVELSDGAVTRKSSVATPAVIVRFSVF